MIDAASAVAIDARLLPPVVVVSKTSGPVAPSSSVTFHTSSAAGLPARLSAAALGVERSIARRLTVALTLVTVVRNTPPSRLTITSTLPSATALNTSAAVALMLAASSEARLAALPALTVCVVVLPRRDSRRVHEPLTAPTCAKSTVVARGALASISIAPSVRPSETVVESAAFCAAPFSWVVRLRVSMSWSARSRCAPWKVMRYTPPTLRTAKLSVYGLDGVRVF